MGLQMIDMRGGEAAGLICPMFVCDVCCTPITMDDNIEWPRGAQGEPVDDRLYAAHKRCTRALEAKIGHTSWRPVRDYLAQLVKNTENPLDLADARPRADRAPLGGPRP